MAELTKPSIYIESTIVSYYTARDTIDVAKTLRQEETREWWDRCREEYDVYVSELVYNEVSQGDFEAASRRLQLIEDISFIGLDESAGVLARRLIEAKAIPEKAFLDALHISIAATNGMMYLLTWNCKHIANATRLTKIRQVIEENGYSCPQICTPSQLL